MRIVNCEQGTPEWMQARCGIATASCFSNILATIKSGEAAARRNYRAKLVVERLTGKVVSSDFQSASMIQGIAREPLARDAYSEKTGTEIEQVGFMVDDLHQAGASPDGLIGDDGGLEIKCPELATHLEYLRLRSEPPAYTAQIQGCMWISGRKWWDFVSWNPDFPAHLQMIVRRVHRDDDYITSLQLAVARFMQEVREEEIEIRSLPEAA
jgi:hypothetical protein